MNAEDKTNKLDPKIRLAFNDATEARALFAALQLSYEYDGSMPATLQKMLWLRLGAIKDRLEIVINTYDVPF